MAPRANIAKSLGGLVDSDSEPDFEDFGSISPRKMATVKRGRGRPPATNKISKPSQNAAALRTSGGRTLNRQALAVKSNIDRTRGPKRKDQSAADHCEVGSGAQSEDQEYESVETAKVEKQSFNNKLSVSSNDITGSKAAAKRGRPPAKNAEEAKPSTERLDAQYEDAMDVEEDERLVQRAEETMPTPETDYSVMEHEASDISLRRRLGELSRKYRSLESRYRDLREVGVKEAEQNYDRLQKQSEDNTRASSKLILQLKDELATQTERAREVERLEKQLEQSNSKMESLDRELAEAKSEVRSLSNKLAAARSNEASIKVPGGALKAGAGTAARVASSNAMKGARATEDLYSDLTGLIVRGLQRVDKEDVFDCIQTGRNGTLHFKLAVDSAEAVTSYDNVQFTYRPQLDPDRDSDMMDVLPNYLVEEITFMRPQASKFYSRVVKSLTERLE